MKTLVSFMSESDDVLRQGHKKLAANVKLLHRDMDDDHISRGLAENPSVGPEILHKLSTHWRASVRERVASNPSTSETTLRLMVYDDRHNVSIQDRLKKRLGEKYA